MSTVRLSLISHTNVGKTTLARTLLKREVGEVRDAAHVTEVAERYALIETPAGDVLEIWDTPGFGDSARLLRRLRQSGNALGWFLSQVWDRYTDRPFFSSQQAVRNVRDTADVVLYLVNASEDPAVAGYVAAEMEILGWIGKPVLVLLNQLGPPQPAEVETEEVGRWAAHLSPFGCVTDVIAFDAFARCWVQEQVLLDRISAALPENLGAAFDRIASAWETRNVETFERAMDVLARDLARAAADREDVAARSLGESAKAWLRGLAGGEARGDPALEAAQAAIAGRLESSVRNATQQLIELHGLSGRAAEQVGQRMGAAYTVDPAANIGRVSVLGAAVTGALGGLAADLAAGGLTFGAGALIGGVLGAAGAHGLARAYNLARGTDSTTVRWSADFLTGRVSSTVLRYLAVAHFGRGRGDYVQGEYPMHWLETVQRVVGERRSTFEGAWDAATKGASAATLEPQLRAALRAVVLEVLQTRYPQRRLPA